MIRVKLRHVYLPYPMFERIRLIVSAHQGLILDEAFGADVTLTARFAVGDFPIFQRALAELSRGAIQAEVIETAGVIVPIR